MDALTIAIDTQRQTPLSFSVPTERGTLATGDYSAKGLAWVAAVEMEDLDNRLAKVEQAVLNRDKRGGS